ncbi:MAG TPA: hypothetical protein VGG41_12215 [Solirubrobacteraceae bacterium]
MNAPNTNGRRTWPGRRLSYANVVATLALVLAVGGGSAFAAGSLSGASKPKHKPPKHKSKLTLNSSDKAYISSEISSGHVAFATSAASATTANSAASATTATNATNATTAANALSLGGTLASGYTHNDCASQTGQVKGFVLVVASPTFSSTPITVGGYNCSGQAIQVFRANIGVYDVNFVGSPVTIAVGNGVGVPGNGMADTNVSFSQVGAGEFQVYLFHDGTAADFPFAVVTP